MTRSVLLAALGASAFGAVPVAVSLPIVGASQLPAVVETVEEGARRATPFGHEVRAMVEEGLRGCELAAAIHETRGRPAHRGPPDPARGGGKGQGAQKKGCGRDREGRPDLEEPDLEPHARSGRGRRGR